MTFGDKLREARKNKGYTQEQIAHLLGIAKSTYTGYEKGVREPDLFKIKRLVEVLDVDSSWLLGVDDSPSSITAAEYQAIKKYRALDERGKMAVDSTLAREYEISSRNAAAVVSDMASTISAADVALTGAAVKK
jgi:transcriptional regulator with XRE-family HTH domain